MDLVDVVEEYRFMSVYTELHLPRTLKVYVANHYHMIKQHSSNISRYCQAYLYLDSALLILKCHPLSYNYTKYIPQMFTHIQFTSSHSTSINCYDYLSTSSIISSPLIGLLLFDTRLYTYIYIHPGCYNQPSPP